MNKRTIWIWSISFLFIFIIAQLCLCTGSDDTEKSEYSDYEPDTSGQNLDKLYLGTDYLLPYQPGNDDTNKSLLPAQNHTTFSHNIRDRKFNDKIKPELDLWLDAHGRSGLKLEFEIVFQAVEDRTLLPEKTYKILFKDYTTNGSISGENLKLTFTKYDGKTFDIKYGNDNWCTVYLTIKRTDNETASKLHIYTGAENKTSQITIPYDKTLSAYEYVQKKKKEDENKSTPGFTISHGVLALVALLIIFNLKGSSRRIFRNK